MYADDFTYSPGIIVCPTRIEGDSLVIANVGSWVRSTPCTLVSSPPSMKDSRRDADAFLHSPKVLSDGPERGRNEMRCLRSSRAVDGNAI